MKIKIRAKSYIYKKEEGEVFDRVEEIKARIVSENEKEKEILMDTAFEMILRNQLNMCISESDGDYYELSWTHEATRRCLDIYLERFNLDIDGYNEEDLKEIANKVIEAIEAAVDGYLKKKYTFETEVEKEISL